MIEAAKVGFRGTGVELNPWLVLFSRWNARRNKVHKLTTFQTKDLWKVCILYKTYKDNLKSNNTSQ